MTNMTLKVGDTFWQGHGLMNGRDVDDATTDPCETEAEALEAIETEWLTWLSDRERATADVYAVQMRVVALDEDGSVGMAVGV